MQHSEERNKSGSRSALLRTSVVIAALRRARASATGSGQGGGEGGMQGGEGGRRCSRRSQQQGGLVACVRLHTVPHILDTPVPPSQTTHARRTSRCWPREMASSTAPTRARYSAVCSSLRGALAQPQWGTCWQAAKGYRRRSDPALRAASEERAE